MKETKKALLVVSFGTSYAETRKKNIEQLELELSAAFPDRAFYHAYTSGMILKKLRSRDGIFIPTVTEAMEQICHDGITDLLVQPTHIINGVENDIMTETILSYREQLDTLCIGAPLLSSTKDQFDVIHTLVHSLSPLSSREALVFMGHGTDHHCNSIYAALDYAFKSSGCPNIHVGTVEAYPALSDVLQLLARTDVTHIYLAPFMLVAGDHATNDLAGNDEDSWKCILEAHGYQVTCLLKGLGEYEGIRKLYLEHAAAAKSAY